ncbi:HAMP domain-containing histidine kinase [Reichenbachiella carrageenanivorans]|uniref:histidine kinase n=1 Tax=Reichenbachiella carrageenanivorans TaxID=2979869 RepID=A0ABY6D0V1_9BACT|nr:HAMP domain-containing sensor histidine kinase [Reichenbachiella carrageenanivorans]UXX78688.1 HAMP domain-containing histidine kinase [Reichenbachiella carrageenanivorans]
MTKLLNRPLKAFALFSMLILLISVPVYVLVIDYIWVSELDENNWLTLQHTKEKLKSRDFTADEIEKINQIWGELQPGVSITKIDESNTLQDSVYEVIRNNVYDEEDGEDRFRGLKSHLVINDQSYQINIETNVEESDETLLAVAVVTFLFFVLLIIGFIFLNRRIAAKSWKPFYQTLQSLQSFDLAIDKRIVLEETNIYEFRELNQALTRLVEGNVRAFQQQKSFTENASHELQTPIALLKSRLDLLLQQRGVTPEISDMISSVEAPLSRLSRINKNLLLLAKVENNQYQESEHVSMYSCLENSLALFEDYVAGKKLKVESSFDRAMMIDAHPFLLETLVNNLLSNAIRHTPIGGSIALTTGNGQLIVTNSGAAPLAADSLFKRFSAVSNEVVGSGLGLAIVQEIASKYNWSVEYSFREQHTFSVVF